MTVISPAGNRYVRVGSKWFYVDPDTGEQDRQVLPSVQRFLDDEAGSFKTDGATGEAGGPALAIAPPVDWLG